MKFFTFLVLLLTSFDPSMAAYNCNQTCGTQCGIGGGFVEPTCQTACKTWEALNCWDVSNPWGASWGEAGKVLYPEAATEMFGRNPQVSFLSESQQAALRPVYGDLVRKVRIHWGSRLMDQYGNGIFKVDFEFAKAQTYGYDIYVRAPKDSISWYDQTMLIAHELTHVRQFEQRGESLANFGRDYFNDLFSYGYDNSPMEKEANKQEDAMVDDISAAYYRELQERRWDFRVCNQTSFDTIYVTFARREEVLSLIPIIAAHGWYQIKKGECDVILRDYPGSFPLWAKATSGGNRNPIVWGNNANWVDYCVSTKAFELSKNARCDQPDQYRTSGFKFIQNPWTMETPQKTFTWNLTSSDSPTPDVLSVCNETSHDKIYVALLQRLNLKWLSRGWYSVQKGRCLEHDLGHYSGDVAVYAEDGGQTWGGTGDASASFCVTNKPFEFDHGQLGACTKGGGRVVKGHKIEMKRQSYKLRIQ